MLNVIYFLYVPEYANYIDGFQKLDTDSQDFAEYRGVQTAKYFGKLNKS